MFLSISILVQKCQFCAKRIEILGEMLTFSLSVGQCEVFVCLGFGHFILFVYSFPWPRSSKGPRMGRQFFKNVDFSVTYPLKGV